MIILGLTGSIGMGKSTAASMLRKLGVPVIDSDALVHDLLGVGGAAVGAVAAIFPQAHDKKARKIDRETLGKIIFGDAVKKKALEDILYPEIQRMRTRLLHQYARSGVHIVALDIPLLYETGRDALCDYVVVVSAPEFMQRRRVLARPGMDDSAFKARLAHQMPDVEKRKRADFVVQTGNGYAYTYRQLHNIVRRLKNVKG